MLVPTLTCWVQCSLDECGLVALCGVFRVFYLQCSVDNENFASYGKESTCNVGDLGWLLGCEIPWSRKWQPTPGFLPRKDKEDWHATVHGLHTHSYYTHTPVTQTYRHTQSHTQHICHLHTHLSHTHTCYTHTYLLHTAVTHTALYTHIQKHVTDTQTDVSHTGVTHTHLSHTQTHPCYTHKHKQMLHTHTPVTHTHIPVT